MKKIILFCVSCLFLAVCMAADIKAASFVENPEEETASSIPAYLFLSDSCPWCRKLKQQGFPAKFRNKYAGQVTLKEYEIHTPAGKQQFRALAQKHQLDGGVPVLIIGETVISGYSDDILVRAGQAVQKERKTGKYQTKKRTSKKEQNLPMVISITMEDEELAGVAPAEELQQMQAYLDRVREDNGEMLSSMNRLLNAKARNQAMAIANTYEQKMKELASASPSFDAFKKDAAKLEAEQQKALDRLVRSQMGKTRK